MIIKLMSLRSYILVCPILVQHLSQDSVMNHLVKKGVYNEFYKIMSSTFDLITISKVYFTLNFVIQHT
jgi:hypothetical protein